MGGGFTVLEMSLHRVGRVVGHWGFKEVKTGFRGAKNIDWLTLWIKCTKAEMML